MKRQIAGLVLAVCVLQGCGRRANNVAEISVDSSGVAVTDLGVDLSQEWSTWRGPLQNGIALSPAAPTHWDESSVKWETLLPGRGHGSPIVVGDLVVVATAIDQQSQQLVLAYDRNTGEKKWETTIHKGRFPSAGELHQKGSNANSTLASDGERLFIAFLNGGEIIATALDFEGNQVWQQPLGAFTSRFGFAPSPVLYKSLVIVAADNWGGGYIAAMDGASGKIAWRISRAAKNSHSTPLIADLGGRDQLLISGCDTVDSYDPATGEKIWSTPGTTETTCGTMVVLNDHVFASGGYPGKQTICLDAEGNRIWDNQTKIYEPSMLAVDSELYAVSDDGIAYCWNAADGELQWRERLGGNFSASPVLCNGNLYVSDLSGKTFVFKASPDGYEEVAVNVLGNDCYASPAILNEQLFLRIGVGRGLERKEKLVCIAD